MDLSSFKLMARKAQQELGHPVGSLHILQEVTELLRKTTEFSADVDYIHLCELLVNRLKEQVNPFRHRTVLDNYQEPAQLRAIEPWLQLWTETLTTLPCAAARIPAWHRTYDIALNRVLTALLKQRLGRASEAAQSWTEAATICRQWLNQNSDQVKTIGYRRLDADYYFFDSRASRTAGEDTLDRRCHEPECFDNVADLFKHALDNMRISNDMSEALEQQVATQEVVQLEYLSSMSNYRAALLRRDFPKARALIDVMKSSAPNARMKLLPYFRHLKELGREHILLEAHEALANRDLRRCLELMDEWRSAWPDAEESVRSKWLEIRASAVAVINGRTSAVTEIDRVMESKWGLGKSNRMIHSACSKFARREIQQNEVFDVVLRFFPLDAAPKKAELNQQPQGNIRWLPSFYVEWLERSEGLVGRGRLIYLHWHYVAMICEFLCGLYNVKINRQQALPNVTVPNDFRLVAFARMRELLLGLNDAMDWKTPAIKELAEHIEAVNKMIQVGDVAEVNKNLSTVFLDVFNRSSANLLPLPLEVIAQERLPNGHIAITLRRVWALSHDLVQLVCREAKGLTDGQFVLMKPKFKFKPAARYDEALLEPFNIYKSSVLGATSSRQKCALLLEGAHDEAAFRILLDEFMPYWAANIELHTGGGSSLPEKWSWLKTNGYYVVTIADGDKRDEWQELSPYFLSPDFEGVDQAALAAAVNMLWGDSLGKVDERRISLILTEETKVSGTVRRLLNYFLRTTHTFSLGSENDMKKRLRGVISGVWVKRQELPKAIADPLLDLFESGFCT